jgi:hypothetical protein
MLIAVVSPSVPSNSRFKLPVLLPLFLNFTISIISYGNLPTAPRGIQASLPEQFAMLGQQLQLILRDHSMYEDLFMVLGSLSKQAAQETRDAHGEG